MSSSTTTTTVPPRSKTVTLHIDTLSDAMKRLGLTAVSASELVEVSQQLETRESTTTPTEEAHRVESREFKQNLTPDEAPQSVQSDDVESVPRSTSERGKAMLKLVTRPAKYRPIPPYTSYPIDGEIIDHAAEATKREHRRKLLELTKATFPDGKVPMPYVIIPAMQYEPPLPFVCASVVILPYDADGIVGDAFDNVWCLWDTGAHCSAIVSSMLRPEVREQNEAGFAALQITFAGTQQTIESTIAFKPELPNQSTFIILGQQTLLNCIRYEVIPIIHDLHNTDGDAYGVLDLQSYVDPIEQTVLQFTTF